MFGLRTGSVGYGQTRSTHGVGPALASPGASRIREDPGGATERAHALVGQPGHRSGPPRQVCLEHGPLTHRGQMTSPDAQGRHRGRASEQRVRRGDRRPPHSPETPSEGELARQAAIVLVLEYDQDVDQIEQAPERFVGPAVRGEQQRVYRGYRSGNTGYAGGARAASARGAAMCRERRARGAGSTHGAARFRAAYPARRAGAGGASPRSACHRRSRRSRRPSAPDGRRRGHRRESRGHRTAAAPARDSRPPPPVLSSRRACRRRRLGCASAGLATLSVLIAAMRSSTSNSSGIGRPRRRQARAAMSSTP